MANDGKLVFPVKFDLNSSVKAASGDIDKVLREMQTRINAKPLTIKPKVDDAALKDMSDRLANLSIPKTLSGSGKNTFLAKEGSINALSAAMQKCIKEWNNLSESERIANRESGEYTAKAQAIISRFAELTAASNTFAKSLQEIARESKTAADAEMKRNQKAAEQVAVLSSQERTLDQVNNKIKQLTQIMRGLDKNDPIWKTLAGNLERVRQKQTELQAAQKAELAQIQGEYNAVKQLISSLQGYGNTIGQIQTKLAAFKSTLNNTTIGGAAFREAALQIKMMNEELQRANQLVQNYQAKSLQGVGKKNTDAAVRQMEQYQQRIQQIDAQMNLAHAKGQDMGSQQMIKLLQERIALEEKLKNAMTTGADAAKQKLDAEIAAQQKLIEETSKRAEAYNKNRQQEAEDLAAQQRKAAEEARIKQESIIKEQQANEARKRILNEQRLSYDTLAQKLQMLENARNKTDIGATRWTRLTAEINKTRDSLKVITDEMDKAAKRSERLARLREILAMSTQSMAGLNARLQEANAQIQNVDRGTAAFDRLAQKIAQLSVEYQKVQQYAQDFAQKAFQGLSTTDTSKRVAELQMWRQQLQQVEEEYNRLRNFTMQNGSNTAMDAQLNALLQQRMDIVRNINQITKTAEQAQVEREKEINRIIESRNAKQKAHNNAITKAVQARKQERTMLMANERTIDNVTKKLQHWQTKLNSTDMRSGQFNQITQEVQRLTAKLERMKQKLAEATGQTEQGANRQKSAVDKASESFRKQEKYVLRLFKRLVAYASFSAVGNFLAKIREVTAQFELQKISLGAILQDQNKANQLFSEIKSFALKSPVKILDLTKYTKQLAAYKIGYDELFETTKRLTDVSVGLGVSMDRIVLLYGQVRTTGYLRASEVRQATEAGIPLVEELAAKLTKANGELVTAADVMAMISKRAISFDMVKEVFEDMTSAGGIFYNTQEKQGNTLYGMWAKLGDAAAIMYDEVGNFEPVNSFMKWLINALTWLMKSWRLVIGEVAVAAAGYGAFRISQKLTTASTIAASKATRDYARAQVQLNAAKKSGSDWGTKAAKASLKAAVANKAAAMSTNLWTAAKYRLIGALKALKAALMSNWITLAITAIVATAVAIGAAIEKATRLQRKITEIKDETFVLQAQSVRNFEYLVKEATTAADGSKKQKDALDELHRTYKDILPEEALRIENLRAMAGNYDTLTQAIRENVAAQQAEKMRSAIKESVNADIKDEQKTVRALLSTPIYGSLSDTEIDRFLLEFEKRVTETGEATKSIIEEINESLNLGLSESTISIMTRGDSMLDPNYFQKLAKSHKELEERLKGVSEWEQQATLNLGAYNQAMVRYNKTVEAHLKSGDTMLGNQQNVNMQIKYMGGAIQQAFKGVGIAWKGEWADIVKEIDPNDLNKTTTLNMEAILAAIDPNQYPELYNYISNYKKLYDELIPSDLVVQQIRAKLFAISDATGVSMDKLRRFLWDGKTSVDDHLKSLNDQITQYKAKLKEMQTAVTNGGLLGFAVSLFFGGKIKETKKIIEALTAQAEFVKTYTIQEDKSSGRSHKSDNRLQELQEINQTLEKINKEYNDLQKKEGKTKALEDIKEQFKDTLTYTNKLGKKFGLHFDFPTEFKSLQQYRNAILKVMKSLKKLKGGEKAILEFQTMINKADSDELQKQIEKQLKELADRISRTKIAKEFYEKILGMTGDEELAANVTFSIYGEDGKDLKKAIADQVRKITNGFKLPDNIISADNDIDHKALRDWAEVNKDELGGVYDELIKISDNGQKELAEVAEQGAKLLLSYDEIAQKRVNIEQEASNKIRQLRETEALFLASQASEEEKTEYSNRTNKAVAGVVTDRDLKLLKLKNEYIRFFSAIHSLTKKEAETLRGEVRQALFKAFQDGVISADELKRELKAIDEQFRKLSQDSGKFVDYLEGGFDGLINRLRTMADEMMSVGSEIGKMDSVDQISEGQKSFIDTMLKQFGNDATGNSFSSLLSNTNGDLAEMGNLLQGVSGEMGGMAAGGGMALAIVDRIITDVARTIEGIGAIRDQLNEMRSDDNQLEGGAWDAFEYLENFNKYAAQGWEDLKSGNVVGAVQNTVQSIISIFGTAQAQRVRRANKEIKRQQELLDQLEYAYSRLEKAMEKAFGGDYLSNYKQQLQNLRWQAAAYQAQLAAEQSKGKKADDDKIKEYAEAYRDTMDEIADMQGQIAAQMFGMDLTSAARDFAQAWIDAYKEFSSTADSMSEKFHDMIENMIVESLLGQVMKNALQPAFDMIDNMSESDFYSQDFWERVAEQAEISAKNADSGAQTMMKFLEKAGISVRDTGAELSGISRDISSASEESINGLAAGINTQNFYISQQLEEVRRIRTIIEAGLGSASLPTTGNAVDYMTMHTEAMGQLTAINQHTAEAVSECCKIALQCSEEVALLRKVIIPKGGSAAFGVKVYM